MLSVSGVLASSSMGWPSVFYFSGSIAVLWAILWLFIGSSSPAENKLISVAEREYIQSSLGHLEEDPEFNEKKHMKTPWRDILTSLPVYALIIVHSAQNWGFWMLLTKMPTYMKGVLKYDIKQVSKNRERLECSKVTSPIFIDWFYFFSHFSPCLLP